MDMYIRNRYCPCVRCKMNDSMGPAILVTVGTLFLLNNTTHFLRGSTVFAVILIVVGAVKLLQGSASIEGHIPPGAMPPGSIPPVPPAAPGSTTSQSNEVQNG